MLSDISIIMRFGGVAQSGCCLRQAGVKSRGKKKKKEKDAKKSRQEEERTLDDNPRRRCETLECKLGIQVERGRCAERWVYVSKPGTDKNCSLTISGYLEIPWQGRKFLRRSFPLVMLRGACFTGITTAKRKLEKLVTTRPARLSTAIHFWTRMGTWPTVIFKSSLYWPRIYKALSLQFLPLTSPPPPPRRLRKEIWTKKGRIHFLDRFSSIEAEEASYSFSEMLKVVGREEERKIET